MRTRLDVCLVVALASAACGGGGSSPDAAGTIDAVVTPDAAPDATPTVTVDSICGAYQALIDKIIQCHPEFDLLLTQGRATPTALSAFCHGSTAPYLADGTETLPTYAQVQACLDYAAQTSCHDIYFEAPACNLLVGTVPDDGLCDVTDQCADASYCERGSSTCGQCKPRLADGMTCDADEQCANGACVGTQCGHKGQDGDPCQADDDCLGDRTCDTASHKCETTTWALNDACTGLGDCGVLRTDLYCKPTNGVSGAGQCAHFAALGATCDPNQPFANLCDLRSYQWCNPQATGGPKCSPPEIVQDGQPCNAFGGQKCADGLVCNDPVGQAGGECYAPGKIGDTCGNGTAPPCDLFMGCVANQCAYEAYTGTCPAP